MTMPIWMTARASVGFSDVRVRADGITAVRVSDNGLLLHVAGQDNAIPLTLTAAVEPAERSARLAKWADDLLGCIEERETRRQGGLVVFEDADKRYEAGFCVRALPGLETVLPRRQKPVDYSGIPMPDPATVQRAPSLNVSASEVFSTQTKQPPPRGDDR
ncbi:hypothetical protein [Streptomyces lydicus]|uniref:hypothetical protein n=1 Tax=Streptomyces lydicus TaxID=47763 RepID=UPI0036E36048